MLYTVDTGLHDDSQDDMILPSTRLRRAVVALAAAFALALSLVSPSVASSARASTLEEVDPWYRDVGFHWAEEYIYVLWQEKVTDGELSWWFHDPRAYYLPDAKCTRAQFTVLLTKTFGLSPVQPTVQSFPDVHPNYTFIWPKNGFKWIEAALRAGLTVEKAGERFYPDNNIERQDAVELLIRALGLGGFAASLPEDEVVDLLSEFRDGFSTAPEHRRSMACAIKLGIINGYPDDTLQPARQMARSEATAIVYRSCIIRVQAGKSRFSPDGDGINETVSFTFGYLKNRGITDWELAIEDNKGHRVFTFGTDPREGVPPMSVTWHGQDRTGKPASPGEYLYYASVVDRSGRTISSVKMPLELVQHMLDARVYPKTCMDDDYLTISADTQPEAVQVRAIFSNGNILGLVPNSSKTHWGESRIMGPWIPPGDQYVKIEAFFAETTRSVQLSFRRVPKTFIEAWVIPEVASWDQTVRLECEASADVTKVTAELPWEIVELAKSGGIWSGSSRVPSGTTPGQYQVQLSASSPSGSLRDTVYLEVIVGKREDLVFYLNR